LHCYEGVTLITKFRRVPVTLEAGTGETYFIPLSISGSIKPHAVADGGFLPLIEQGHVVGSHVFFRFHALSLDGNDLRLKFESRLSIAVAGQTNRQART
jgi:hypothetical protein